MTPATSVRPIRRTGDVRGLGRETPEPGCVFVLLGNDGARVVQPGERRPFFGWGRYERFCEVDCKAQLSEFKLSVPSRDPLYRFEIECTIQAHVYDPVEFVSGPQQSSLHDGFILDIRQRLEYAGQLCPPDDMPLLRQFLNLFCDRLTQEPQYANGACMTRLLLSIEHDAPFRQALRARDNVAMLDAGDREILGNILAQTPGNPDAWIKALGAYRDGHTSEASGRMSRLTEAVTTLKHLQEVLPPHEADAVARKLIDEHLQSQAAAVGAGGREPPRISHHRAPENFVRAAQGERLLSSS